MKSESIVSSTGSKAAKSTAATSIRKSVKSTAQAKAPAAKPAPVTPITAKAPPAPKGAPVKVVDAPQSVILGPVMRKKELIDTVVEQTGRKKKDVKPVVEAMLSVLGDALGDNRELNLPPFGRLMVRKEKDLANGRMVVAKIRQTGPKSEDRPAKPAKT